MIYIIISIYILISIYRSKSLQKYRCKLYQKLNFDMTLPNVFYINI